MSEKYCIAVIVLIFAISGVSQTPSPTPETLGPILTEEVVIMLPQTAETALRPQIYRLMTW